MGMAKPGQASPGLAKPGQAWPRLDRPGLGHCLPVIKYGVNSSHANSMACHGICHGMSWNIPWHVMDMPWHVMAYAMAWHVMAYAIACHGICHGMPWHMHSKPYHDVVSLQAGGHQNSLASLPSGCNVSRTNQRRRPAAPLWVLTDTDTLWAFADKAFIMEYSNTRR